MKLKRPFYLSDDMEQKTPERAAKLACPACGKSLPVRIVRLSGEMRCTVRCPRCGRVSVVEMKDI